ncbi:MAG: class I SAM-dependent methyltransferase [Parvularculaceae bacterium]|nr:class I SAM-dependent methyltransferase [Parvularculaceae bacterium]
MESLRQSALNVVPAEAEQSAWAAESGLVKELDDIATQMRGGDVQGGMARLIDTLRDARETAGSALWRDELVDAAVSHPVKDLVLHCPITSHSRSRPRGYPGDAELLDHIYGMGAATAAPHPATLRGQFYYYGVWSPACTSVRHRRDLLAKMIDSTAATCEKPSILSIACGHLREAEFSRAVTSGGIGRFVALDQDERSLAEVERAYSQYGVEAVQGSVRGILGRKVKYADFDFVYAAGLFDYLVEPIAMRLIERMFEFVRPGGKILIANFTPATPDVGHMETFMDWWLIYRDQDQVRHLFDNLPADELASLDVFSDDAGVIAYAVAEKAAG